MESIAEQATAAAVARAMPRFADGTIIEEVFQGAAWQRCVVHLMRDCPRAADVWEAAEADALAYLDFPASHWKRLRTNNLQERTNREIKRRSRVVQVFPSVRSLERLAGAVMCEQDEAWSEAR